ncbi:hypothetical protein Tco_0430903 [Tanacetum coccineum]
MRNYNPPVHESAPAHPFLAVMNKEYDGHCRLFDRGVTNTLIKKVNGDGSASAVLREIVNHPRSSDPTQVKKITIILEGWLVTMMSCFSLRAGDDDDGG